jgi:hypothetical protein
MHARTIAGEEDPMLREGQDLLGHSVEAADGLIGTVKDLYFDDESWVIRYFVVATGPWLSGRRVLIVPASVTMPVWESKRVQVGLTKQQVRDSPGIDTNEPVSRQHEREYLRYYGYPFYWEGGTIWGRGAAHPGSLVSEPEHEGAAAAHRRSEEENRRADAQADAEHRPRGDHHLRSMETVKAYRIHAFDGEIGHVKGFLIDELGWVIRYMVVGTGEFWRGHDVLISPEWIDECRWDDNCVLVGLTRDAVKRAPAYRAGGPLTREIERNLQVHYGFGDYWAREVELQNPEPKFRPSETPRPSADRR